MSILIALVIGALFSYLFRKPIRKCPVAFYALAVVVDVVFLSQMLLQTTPAFARMLFPYSQRALLGFALIAVVMFIGVFPESSRVRRELSPIRGELSIIAAILIAGHMTFYLGTYLGKLLAGFVGMSGSMALAFALAIVLVVLLAILTVTSFSQVKRRMQPTVWKRLQKLAYVFFLLVYVHLACLLLPSATGQGSVALVSVVVYTVVVLAYVVLRVRKALIDGARRPDHSAS